MNVVSLLNNAINEKKWDDVYLAYSLLTGEQQEIKEPPKKKGRGRPKKISIKEESKEEDFSVKRKTKDRKVSFKSNKFESMKDAIAEAGKEEGFDKINDDVRITERNRKKFEYKKVTCTQCNKSFDVHPLFARSSYTCDSCLGKRRG